jgi:hypothetical protein
MGSWGTALYSNDTSSDVRDLCNEVYPLVGIEEGTKLILQEYADLVDSDMMDNDYADFWFALADWQWKHGILTDEIKSKAIALLEAHTGLDEWAGADQKKRLSVMDKLLDQLKTPQPEIKIPKAQIPKPKHKPGDIIIFRTCDKDYEYADSVWNIDDCGFAGFYQEEVASKLPENISPPYEAYKKYMAVLCVGTVQEAYSQYVPHLMEVHSIYAYYDYINDRKPSLDDLKACGFLPLNIRYGSDADDIGKNAWTYTFRMCSQSYAIKKQGASEEIVEKLHCADENNRFHSLFSKKHYDSEYALLSALYEVFSEIYTEKVRLDRIGIKLDNLLDNNQTNPALRTPKEIEQLIHMERIEWEKKVYELENSEVYKNADENEKVAMLRILFKEDTAVK